jgi:hypothetical protein
MIQKQSTISFLFVLFLLVACTKNNPCDNPKTVKELLACANTVGTVTKHKVMLGSDLNKGCDNSWNAKDTVLTVVYKDSISLWRVNQEKNTSAKLYGTWFTNYSAKAAGLTKEEVLNRFALNPCPDDTQSYNTCSCKNGKEPIDSVIQYEVEVKLGANQPFLFGVVGESPFGKGGEMQWHRVQRTEPRFKVLQQIPWE